MNQFVGVSSRAGVWPGVAVAASVRLSMSQDKESVMKFILLTLAATLLGLAPAAPRSEVCDGCDGTSSVLLSTAPSGCLDLSTLNFGIMSSDGACREDCSTLTQCKFTYYADGVAKAGCGTGCTVEYITGSGPPWKPFGPAPTGGFRLENWPEDCGGVNAISIFTRCSSACSGSCSSPTGKLLGTLSGICTDCN